MARLLCVAPSMVPEIWPYAGPMIRRATERGGGDFDRTETEVLAGLQLLWIVSDDGALQAAATTQLVNEGQGKACIIVACSGRQSERWLPLIVGIEDYAKAEGCKTMRVIGRKGWERVLSGYRAKYVTLEKEII